MDYKSLLKKYKLTSIPYNELLQTGEWKEKRKVIVERDNSCCRNCGITKSIYFKDCEIAIDTKDEIKHSTIVFENISLDEFLKNNNTDLHTFSIDDDITSAFSITGNKIFLLTDWNFVAQKDFKELVINKGVTKNKTEYFLLTVKGDDISKYSFAIPKIQKEKIWLHVHHTYYIFEYLPWSYPNESLITLCHNCHMEYHKNEKFPIFVVINGKLYPADYTQCEKCSSAGIIPEYMHVQNGICFNCGGKGFLQLIKVGTVSAGDLQ